MKYYKYGLIAIETLQIMMMDFLLSIPMNSFIKKKIKLLPEVEFLFDIFDNDVFQKRGSNV